MPNYKTGNHAFLRQQNLIGIMHHLYDNAPISRADLSRLSRLNKTTVSSLIEELLENGFVREIGIEKPGTAGRSSVLLDIDPHHGYIVSGEIGVDFVHIICTDFTAKVVWRHKEHLQGLEQNKAISHILETLQTAVRFVEQQGRLLGLALGVHGLLEKDTGTLVFAPNLGWQNVPLLNLLKQEFQTEIFVDNEANLAALGEQFFGSAQGHNEVLYISAGAGLGGGLVLRGQMYNGSTGFAGEFGHMTINPEGISCQCGNRGCWETEVSQSALFRHFTEAVKDNTSSVLTLQISKTKDGKLLAKDVAAAAQAGDAVALTALEKVGNYLGLGLASLLNVLNPSLIVLGGELSFAADYLLPAAEKELAARSLRWSREKSKIVVARFGSDAAIIGGVAKVFQTVLTNLSGLKRNNHRQQIKPFLKEF